MYREDYKVTVPQFKRLEVLLSDCGAISGKLDIETGRHNARVINDKVKALSDFGWYKYVGLDGKVIAMEGFGASGPAATLFEHFGFTVDNVVKTVKEVVNA